MVEKIKGTSKLYKHPKANTMYVTIPADFTGEGFPFKNGEKVKLELIIDKKIIIISKFE